MRVSCESCGAQYNLPDEKVRGRRAKVRCKRCQATIVVDGTSNAPAPLEFEDDGDEATQVMDSSRIRVLAAAAVAAAELEPRDPSRWTVNLSEAEQYEMTTDQIVEGWLAGLVSDDAYVWRDGLQDWTPIADVAELVNLINAAIDQQDAQEAGQAAALAAEPEPPTVARAQQVHQPVPRTAPAPSLPAPTVPQPTRAALPQPTAFLGGGLGAGARAKQAPVPAAPPTAQPFFPSIEETQPLGLTRSASRAPQAQKAVPRAPQAPKPPQASPPEQPRRGPPPREQIGERHENSVLFSLDALKGGNDDDARDRISEDLLTAAPAGGANDFNFMPLIEVEPIAATAVQTPAQRVAAQRSIAPSVAPVAPTPIYYSEATPPKGGALKVFAAIVLAGGVLGGAFIGAQHYGLLSPAAQTLLETGASLSTTPVSPAALSAEPLVPLPHVSEPVATAASGSSAEPPTPSGAIAQAPPAARDVETSTTTAPKPKNGATPKPELGPDTDEPTKPTDEEPSEKPIAETAPPAPEKPDAPPAEESSAPPFAADAAKEALRLAASNVSSCAAPDGPTGAGQVQVTFLPSGRVSSANVVSGAFGGTTVGGCVARTFRQARVPAFKGDPVTVSKSFQIGN